MMKENRMIPQENRAKIQETYRVQEEGKTLLEVLQEKSQRSRSASKKLIATGRVAVDGTPTTRAEQVLPVGSCLTVHMSAPALPFRHPLIQLIWENEDYVVLYKGVGIPTVNTAHKNRQETVLFILSQHYKKSDPSAKLFMVTRLDRNTAGFVLLAKSVQAKDLMVKEWGKLVQKQCFATCVEGEVPSREFVLESTTEQGKGRGVRTTTASVRTLKSSALGGMHVLELNVERARIYSLRKLLGDNGLSIVGDVRSESSFVTQKEIALQQTQLELLLPTTHQHLSFQRPFPTHYYKLLKADKGFDLSQLRKQK